MLSPQQRRLLRAFAWTSGAEVAVTGSLALWPLLSASREGILDEHTALLSGGGFATSNVDVALAALARAAAVRALVLAGARAAPAAREKQQGLQHENENDADAEAGEEENHSEDSDHRAPLLANGHHHDDQAAGNDDGKEDDNDSDSERRRRQRRRKQRRCRRAADALTLLALLLLMAKAVAVAVLAPDGLWWSSSPSSAFFCGLGPMYASLLLSMAGAAAGGLLARLAVGKSPAARTDGDDDDGRGEHNEQSGANNSSSRSNSNKQAFSTPAATTTSTTNSNSNKKPSDADGASARRTLRELLRLSAPDAPVLALAFAAGAAAAVFSAAVPFYTGRVIDRASIDPDRRELLLMTLKLVAVGALCGVFTGLRGGLFTLAMTRLNVRLRSSLLRSLLAQEQAFYDATPVGELTSRLSADCESVSNSVALNLNVAFRSVLQAAVVLAFMFGASWRLTVVTFVIVPATMALSHVYGRFYHRLARRVQRALAEANAVAEEALGAVGTVRAHGAAGATSRAYDARLAAFARLENRAALAYVLNAAAVTFLPVVTAAGVLYFGGTLVLAGRMSAGALVSYMLYQTSLASAFGQLGDVFSALASAVGAAAKVIELLRREPRMPPCGALTAPPGGGEGDLEGRVELRGVHFAYPTRPSAPVLRGLDVSIEPGGTLALVGASGGGKSTVLQLVQRMYVPSRGRVLIDGADVGSYDDAYLRRRVACVSQNPVLFRRSIRDNILYGLEEEGEEGEREGGGRQGRGRGRPTEEDVIAAAKAANAHDFICAFPHGYDTLVGGRGATLSGGQCARVAIARALVRRPRLALLDEATSSLDAESEHLVQEALDAVIRGHGCTVIMVAHRLSTVVNATKIAVVGGGVVLESGTHEELVRLPGGAYGALVARQLRGAASGGGSSAAFLGAGSGGGGGGGGA